MGVLDTLKFWDSGEDLEVDSELPPLEDETGLDQEESFGERPAGEREPANQDYGMEDYDPFEDEATRPQQPQISKVQQGQNVQQGSTGDVQKDLELISSKLDAIKSELDSMDQRIRKIEKIAEGEQAQSEQGRDPWANYR